MTDTLTTALERSARNLYDARLEARPYVYNRSAPEGVTSDDWRAATAARVLERVDAALADAGEVWALTDQEDSPDAD